MTLKIQVTTAGRAALVNAQNTGTLPVTVAKIGVTDQAFVADATLLALPGQLKQLDTFSGSAVAADTIHVTIRDFSTDTYSLRGFGLFLADGTLFAAYGQADPILEKSAQAAMLLATDVIFADIDAASLTFGDTNFLNPPATTEVQGVIEVATDQESIDGLDPLRAVPPKGLLAALNARFGAGAPSAFVKGLLTAATALAFRTALAIKGAALYDTGTGNGLDADLLDGQHGAYYRDWASLQNVPATFAPAPHQHSAADITSGTLVVARGGTGAGTFTAGSYLVGNGTDPLASKTPAQVLVDIGAAAKVHSHAIGDVNGLQLALDGKLANDGNAVTASKLKTARNISLGGLLGGSVTFDGALDVTINATMADGALSIGKTYGLQSALDGKISKGGDGNIGDLAVGTADTTGAQLRVYGNTPAGYDVSAVAGSVPDGMFLDGAGGVGAGGTVVFGAGGKPFAFIKAYFTNGAGNGVGRLCIGTRTSTADASLTNKITIGETGDATFAGAVTANGGFQNSDRRLKTNIKPRQVQRGFALKIARMFCEWDRIADGVHDVGLVAQRVRALAARYVKRGDDKRGTLAIDKAGIALEASMDCALQLAEQATLIRTLLRRIDQLERHHG